MVTPRTEQIEDKARELFFESNPSVMANPEIDELKEAGYWERARRELMTGVASAEIGEKERQKQGVIEALEDASVMTTIRTIEKNIDTLKSKLEKPITTQPIKEPKKRRVSLKTLRALKKARATLRKKQKSKFNVKASIARTNRQFAKIKRTKKLVKTSQGMKWIKKKKEVRKKMPSGWRINGKRVYSVKGKTKTKKKTYRTKASALRHSHRKK